MGVYVLWCKPSTARFAQTINNMSITQPEVIPHYARLLAAKETAPFENRNGGKHLRPGAPEVQLGVRQASSEPYSKNTGLFGYLSHRRQ